MAKQLFWCSGSDRINIQMTREQAESGSHSGPCDDDISTLSHFPSIKCQLGKISPALLASELKEYGAWDEIELADHDQNLQRILWLACGDISDGNCD